MSSLTSDDRDSLREALVQTKQALDTLTSLIESTRGRERHQSHRELPEPPSFQTPPFEGTTREKLVSAAAHLFATQGYEGTSVNQIAQAVGLTKGAFYSQFPSKEALVIELSKVYFNEDEQAFDQKWSSLLNLPASAARADTANVEQVLLGIELWLFAIRHPEAKKELAELWADQYHALARFLAKKAGRDTPSADDIRAVFSITSISSTAAIFHLIFGLDSIEETFKALLKPIIDQYQE